LIFMTALHESIPASALSYATRTVSATG